MIQDIFPHQFHNEYRPVPPKNGDYFLCFDSGQILLKPDHSLFTYEDITEHDQAVYLFEIDDTAFFLRDLHSYEHVREHYTYMRSYRPKHLGFAGITAYQIDQWMKENRYCGKCGHEMKQDSAERAMRCPECNHIVYPKISPAVIVAVLNDRDQILVTKYANRSYNRYALIAGFAEIGETIEETVKREVKEEVGLEVTDLQYYKCQPWSFSSSLLFGFYCHVKDSDQIISLDENELQMARWADRSEEIDSMDDSSLTTEMIQMFLKGKIR